MVEIRKKSLFTRLFGATAGERAFSCVVYFIFLLVTLTMALPFLYVIVKSFEGYDVTSGVMVEVYTFSAYKRCSATCPLSGRSSARWRSWRSERRSMCF